MPKLQIRKSIVIGKPQAEVYALVRDFRQWPVWSPWLIVEPECRVTYQPDGSGYAWDGQVVGSGRMAIESEDADEEIRYELTFLKPWKSVAKVRFGFAAHEEGTEVTWSMDSSLPLFLFWMKKSMTAFIGMDYQRGLSMLKDFAETGSVPSALEVIGEKPFDGLSFVGVRTRCPIPELSQRMGEDFDRLAQWESESNTSRSGRCLARYHLWDAVTGQVEYTAAIPVASLPTSLPDGLIAGEQPAGPYFQIRHIGPYRHLGNAWSGGMMMSRAKVFKMSKEPGFELYENDLEDGTENELRTLVHYPIKV